MGRPYKINICSYHETPILLCDDYYEKDDDGNKTYYPVNRITLDKIFDEIKNLNIPESEYKHVHLEINDEEYRDNPYLYCVYKKPKTTEEIEKETKEKTEEMEKKIASYAQTKEARKLEKQKKKQEKEELIKSLTPEQKKILGIRI